MALHALDADGGVFPQEMEFRGQWRGYQARLLGLLPEFLKDNRVHVVAAPGSGKTVFGLEVVRRIGKRTLVLAPTVTIRDQWAERLVGQFLPTGSGKPEWVSTEIRRPALLTIATYQALHAVCSGRGEEEASEDDADAGAIAVNGDGEEESAGLVVLPEALAGFEVLVVDEAHHLRAEWWRTLSFVADRLQPAVVALTATPPYDATAYEWQRYEELCGPIDAEISIPELVLAGDLSPHQDYVYFSVPTVVEQRTLEDFRVLADAFVKELVGNREFAAAVVGHMWMVDPAGHVEEILERPEYLSSMVIYLHAAGIAVPKEVLRTLGVDAETVPVLDLEWAEILLTRCLYDDAGRLAGMDAEFRRMRHALLAMGAMERRRVVLRSPAAQGKMLTTSATKLGSIEAIVRMEAGRMRDGLRCVVLTDFIRKGDLPRTREEVVEFSEIGAVPIFERLRRAGIAGMRLGVLCGSLVIVPDSVRSVLVETARGMGVRPEDLRLRPLGQDGGYLELEMRGAARQGVVGLMTALFEAGGITVLVGTKSLLGEGWDAPAINTLVLATFVGTYMLSNQLRGRSIRKDARCVTKTANVWHLACVAPGAAEAGADYEAIQRRFLGFAGVHVAAKRIENGLERLGLGAAPFEEKRIAERNAETMALAVDREGLCKAWEEALTRGVGGQMREGLRVTEAMVPRRFVLRQTIAALMVEAGGLFFFIASVLVRVLGRMHTGLDGLTVFGGIVGVAAAVGLPSALKGCWRLVRHGTPERCLEEIGMAVLESLRFGGLVNGRGEYLVHAETNADGFVACWLMGGTGREESIFTRSMREVLMPMENPRYVLAQRTVLGIFRENYFAVPEVLGRKREFAEFFAKKWQRRVGPVMLVATRSEEGRRVLLRGRMHSLAGAFQGEVERKSVWR